MTATVLARPRPNGGVRYTVCELMARLDAAHQAHLAAGKRSAGPRYPLADLYLLIGPRSLKEVSEATGIDQRQISAMHALGSVTALQADRMATAYGFHACNVWPDFA